MTFSLSRVSQEWLHRDRSQAYQPKPWVRSRQQTIQTIQENYRRPLLKRSISTGHLPSHHEINAGNNSKTSKWQSITLAHRSPLVTSPRVTKNLNYLHKFSKTVGNEVNYRGQILGSRILYILFNTIETSYKPVVAFPIIGIISQVFSLFFLFQHTRCRSHGPVQKVLQAIEIGQGLSGIATIGLFLARIIGNPATQALLGITGVILVLGIIKGSIELTVKGKSAYRSFRAYHQASRFIIPENTNPKTVKIICQIKNALRIERTRTIVITASYALLVAGQALALGSLFIFPPGVFIGIGIALIGSTLRIISTYKDHKIVNQQKQALKTIRILSNINILNVSGLLTSQNTTQVNDLIQQGLFYAPNPIKKKFKNCIKKKDLTAIQRAEELMIECFNCIGLDSSELGLLHWDSLKAPFNYAQELGKYLSYPSTDRDVILNFIDSFMPETPFRTRNTSQDCQRFIYELSEYLPRGRAVFKQSHHEP